MMADSDSLSLVIPAFGRQDLVARALASARDQSSRLREIVLVDDESSATFNLLPEFNNGTVLRIIRHPRNRGAAAARNTGLRHATGDWVTFLDSDDVLLPGTLEHRLDEALAHRDAGGSELACYVCGFEYIWPNRRRREIRLPRSSCDLSDFVSGCWFAPGSCAILPRRPMLEGVGFLDEGLRRLEDLDWFIRFGLAGGVVIASDIVGARIEIQRKISSMALEDAIERLRCRYIDADSLDRLPHNLRKRLWAYLQLEMAASEWYEERTVKALGSMVKSFASHPRLGLHLSAYWTRHELQQSNKLITAGPCDKFFGLSLSRESKPIN